MILVVPALDLLIDRIQLGMEFEVAEIMCEVTVLVEITQRATKVSNLTCKIDVPSEELESASTSWYCCGLDDLILHQRRSYIVLKVPYPLKPWHSWPKVLHLFTSYSQLQPIFLYFSVQPTHLLHFHHPILHLTHQ